MKGGGSLNMEDSRIIELFFERSESAISELENKYGRLFQRIADNILNNEADAQECVNDTYLGIWNAIPPERPQSLIAYACRVARNISLKRYEYNMAAKRNSNFDLAIDELSESLASEYDVETEVEQAELTETIEKFMDSLEANDRIIFMRRYYFSDPYEDIAQMVGISQKNVSVKLTRIRKKLRVYMQDHGYIV